MRHFTTAYPDAFSNNFSFSLQAGDSGSLLYIGVFNISALYGFFSLMKGVGVGLDPQQKNILGPLELVKYFPGLYPRGDTPYNGYTERLCLKGIPFLNLKYTKGKGKLSFWCMKGSQNPPQSGRDGS